MKTIILTLLISTSALACMDKDAQLLKPTRKVLSSYKGNYSFETCVAKLNDVGAKISQTQVYRKNRPAGDVGPVIYQLLFASVDAQGRPIRLKLSYDLRKRSFTCSEGVSYKIPRGGCF